MIATFRTFTGYAPAWTVGLVFLTLNLLFGSWLARIPEVQNRLQLTEGQLGLALLGLTLGGLFITPLSGWLLSRLPAGHATLYSLLAFCLAIALPAFAPGQWSLTAALVLVGLANGFLNVSMNAAAAGVERHFNISILSTCHGLFSLGGMLGAISSGLLAGWGVPLTTHLTGLAILLLGINLYFAPTLLRIPDDKQPETATKLRMPGRTVRLLAFLGFCFIMGEGVIGDWSAVYLRNGLGSDPFLAGMGLAGFSLAMAVGRFAGDGVRTRFGDKALLTGGGLLGAFGLGLAVLSNGPLTAVAGFTIVGLGLSTVVPLLFSAAARAPGATASSGIATVAAAGMLGFIVGRPGVGYLSQHYGLEAGLGVVAVLLVVASLIAARARF